MVTIRAAGDGDLDAVRELLREYAAYLNASVGELTSDIVPPEVYLSLGYRK